MQNAGALRLAEAERERARRAAGRSLRAFYRYVYRLEPPPHADLIVEALEGVLDGRIRRLLIIAPPNHAKSTICSVIFPAYVLGRDPNARLLGISTTDTLAKLFGASVQSALESSPELRETFPQMEPDLARGWSEDGLYLRYEGMRRSFQDKDPSIVYAGAGGSIIGRRSTGIVVDDPIKEQDARSEGVLTSRKNWFRGTGFTRLVRPHLEPNGVAQGWIVAVGTLWADDDVVGTWAGEPEWTIVHLSAEAKSERVSATVTVAEGCDWRPSRGVQKGGEIE